MAVNMGGVPKNFGGARALSAPGFRASRTPWSNFPSHRQSNV